MRASFRSPPQIVAIVVAAANMAMILKIVKFVNQELLRFIRSEARQAITSPRNCVEKLFGLGRRLCPRWYLGEQLHSRDAK
jgi:hypothetical protein